MSSFTSIPLEIRQQIYSYVLEDSHLDRNEFQILTSCHDTSLFTLNNQISSEALPLFYSKHPFVFIETTINILQDASKCIPLFINRHIHDCKSYALKIRVSNNAITQLLTDFQPETAIMSAQYLRNFIRIANSSQWDLPLEGIGGITSVDLEFYTSNDYFKSAPKTRDFFIEETKLFRRIQNTELQINIHGDIDTATAEDIKAQATGPAFTPHEIYTQALAGYNLGKEYYDKASCEAARAEYETSFYTTSVWCPKPPLYTSTLSKTLDSLRINLFLSTSKVHSSQHKPEAALMNAEAAWELNFSPEFGDWRTKGQKAVVKQRIAEALMEAGRWEESAVAFTSALLLMPRDRGIAGKLREVRDRCWLGAKGGPGREHLDGV
ncbi:hypothetical protein B7494_g5877 [Chlorociboria aeruginascens]|nr:hypothetical protein B7494_g5877 [Chlorociboria aeruginascens]